MLEKRQRAYTMPMGRKCAILLLAVVALWAATPTLACLAPAPHHSCCHAMMANCGAVAMGAAHPCCQLQKPNTAVPPTSAVAPDLQVGPLQSPAFADLPNPGDLTGHRLGSAKAPPPLSLLGSSTILRI